MIYLLIYLSIYLSNCKYIHTSKQHYPSIFLSIYPSIYLSFYPKKYSVYLRIYLCLASHSLPLLISTSSSHLPHSLPLYGSLPHCLPHLSISTSLCTSLSSSLRIYLCLPASHSPHPSVSFSLSPHPPPFGASLFSLRLITFSPPRFYYHFSPASFPFSFFPCDKLSEGIACISYFSLIVLRG